MKLFYKLKSNLLRNLGKMSPIGPVLALVAVATPLLFLAGGAVEHAILWGGWGVCFLIFLSLLTVRSN